MPTVETIKIQADVKDAIKGIDKLEDAIKGLEEAQKEQAESHAKELKKITEANKKTAQATSKLAKGFKGVGLAMKAAGIGLAMKLVNALTEAMMKNQKIADTVETVFTAIGLVFKEVSDALFSVFNKVSEATGGFDAMQKVITNLLKIAFTPLKLAFLGIKGAIQGAQLIWEQSWFGDGDEKKIAELKKGLKETGSEIKQVGLDTIEAAKNVATNLGEAVGEIATLYVESIDAVGKVMEEIDVKQTLADAERLTKLKKNYELVALQQQRLIESYDEEAEKQRQIRDDVSKSIDERIEANTKLGEVLEKQLEAEKKVAQSAINNLQQQIALEGESNDLKNQLYQAETELLAISAKVTGFKSEQLTNENALLQEQNQLVQTANLGEQERAKLKAEALIQQETDMFKKLDLQQKELDAENEIALADIEAKREIYAEGTQARIDAEQEYLNRINEIALGQDEIDIQRVEEAQKREEEKRQAKIQTLDTITQIFGAESALGKASLIAKQLMAAQELMIELGVMKQKATMMMVDGQMKAVKSGTDTASGLNATLALGFPAAIPGLVAYAASAVGIVTGIMTAIKKQKAVASSIGGTPSGGGGGGGTPAPAPQPVSPSFNVVGSSDTNQIAEMLGDQNNTPVQAYVVSQDVTTAQSLERNIVETTSL